jgi:hypothetical protein
MKPVYDSKGWNDNMKSELLGFETTDDMNSKLDQLNSQWSRNAAIKFWQTGEISHAAGFAIKEALSQWTNPELVVAGFSAGLAGVGSVPRVAKTSTVALKTNPIKLTTSSGSLAPSRTYTIYNRFGELQKFGVTDANLVRYGQSLKSAGPGAYGKFSSIMYKGKAHTMERYLRSLQFNSTGQYALPDMKYPYPINFNTGLPVKPF